ncbi:MAG: hypothetical protein FWD92_04470 [Methanomassiliicoccaceae archaeon]|nr:hypothetical protein [Methanomassiliicoccaceae archaeon]
MVSVETLVNIAAVVLTVSLIVLNYVILRKSVEQNRESIELYEKNLKLSEETLRLNRLQLEENKKMIERQELDNRPKFIMKDGGFRSDPFRGNPRLYLENIGGKEALAKNAEIIITKNLTSIVATAEINKNIKPGAPLNLTADLPVSVLEYHVQRKDGDPLKENEIIFFSLLCTIEYTHTDDADADPFVDIISLKIGNDYIDSGEYYHLVSSRMSTENDTWQSLLGERHQALTPDE